MPYSKNGLVPIQKLVTRNGRQFIQTYYVSMEESKQYGYQHHLPKKKGKDALQKLLRLVRKDIGSAAYREMLKANGITWEESPHDGVNTMRASMAAYQHLMSGGHIDLGATGKKVSPKLVVKLDEVQRKLVELDDKKPEESKKQEKQESKEKPKDSQQPSNETQTQPSNQPEPPKTPEQQGTINKPNLHKLMERLGVAYREENGTFKIGEGHKTVINKWGKPDTAPGSIRFVGVEKAKNPRWGSGHFIKLDSSFFDKDTIKNELGGKFDPDTKKWYIPFKMFIEAFKTFKNVEIDPALLPTITQVMERIDVNSIDLTKKTSLNDNKERGGGLRADNDIDISDFTMPEGMSSSLNLYDHQKKGVKFLLKNKKAVLGLAVGLGKTLTAITAIQQLKNENKIKRAIVVSPSSVKYNWAKEIEKFSSLKPFVIESKQLRKGGEETWKEAENHDVIVVNYEMLRKPEIREKLVKLAPNCIIADEAHKLKNAKSQQTKGFKESWKDSEYVFFLSATPFPNGKPEETHTMLSHLRPDKVGTWREFGRRFVVWERSRFGAKPVCLKNIDELKEKMADVVFMRNHNSSDVVSSLPKERHVTFNLEMNDEQKKLYKAVAEDIRAELTRLEEQGINASTPAVIAKLKKLEQIAIDPHMLVDDPSKIDMNKLYPKEEWTVQTIVDHLEDPTNRGVVVFCDMKLPLDKVRQGLINEGVEPSKIAYITGDVKPAERTEIQDKMARGDVKVVLCTNAAEEGVNLQFGSHTLVHLDIPWTPKAITQREGRILRQGQPNPYTNFFTPVMTGTVEDRKRATLTNKVNTIEGLLGEGSTGSVANNIKADNKVQNLTIDDIKNILLAEVK